MTTLSDYRETVKHPGKFENESPMVPFIIDNDLFDETDGDVETFVWFGIAGRWVITENYQGFVSGTRYDTARLARTNYNELKDEYQKRICN